VSDLFLC